MSRKVSRQSSFDFGSEEACSDEIAAPWEVDDQRLQLVAEVVFRDPPFGPYSYAVPVRLHGQIHPGGRVRVPLGRGQRAVTGWVASVGQAAERANRPTETASPGPRALKEISGLIDPTPLLSEELRAVAAWLADETLSPLAQVFDTMVPGPVKGQAGTREVLFVDVAPDAAARRLQDKLPAKQALVLQELLEAGRAMTVADLCQRTGTTSAPVTALRKKGYLTTESRRTRTQDIEVPIEPPDRSKVLSSGQAAAVAELIAALRPSVSSGSGEGQGRAPDRLTIGDGLDRVFLLHGVTGSGKTEVYLQVASEVLARKQQVLVLVPEISLTPQTVQRFQARLGEAAILHSRQTDAERAFHWDRIASGQVSVVVGTRSAVFAPLARLGLIVIDEEHDASFKQDQAPRYHARAVATYRAAWTGAPVILGSATPSLETYRHARTGSYRHLTLTARVEDRALPSVRLIDQRDRGLRRRSPGVISEPLDREVRRTLDERGQVILLLNRRGFSTTVQCPACGHVVMCPHCDTPLTHHREQNGLICHLCDHREPPPTACPDCGTLALRFSGVGTEKLEDEVRRRFPEARMARLDGDTLRKRGSHVETLAEFRRGDLDLLLGTQMIAKGLDFPDVTLVGVVNADTGLHLPDFRAAERTFQLVTQVAGRTGRGPRGGAVLVQTFSPDHPAIDAARDHDYVRFASGELAIRREHGYPPFADAVRIIVRGPVEERVRATIEAYAVALLDANPTAKPETHTGRQSGFGPSATEQGRAGPFGLGQGGSGQGGAGQTKTEQGHAGRGVADLETGLTPSAKSAEAGGTTQGSTAARNALRLLGPAPAPLARIKGRYRWHVLVLSPDRSRLLAAVRRAMERVVVPEGVERAVDVDPLDMQ